MKADLDKSGRPIVPSPLNADTLVSQITRFCLIHFVFSLIVPLFVMSTVLRGKIKLSELKDIYKAVSEAHDNRINTLPEYQDKDLIRQLWEKDSARPYIDGDALEYQIREGYCNSATVRCTFKSFPSYPREKIPPQKSEPTDPEKWKGMDVWDTANGNDYPSENGGTSAKSSAGVEMFPGSCTYPEFLSAVKRGLEDPSCRVVLNYLRSALFGFVVPWWLPAHLCLALAGGHFSPIVGMVETEKYKGDNPLIGVFDVNHKYGGAYLVPAKTLFRSVRLMDVASQKPRAMILVHEPTTTNQSQN
mmetsp:Transcript_40356/g.97449  ORF Transcript_40356/g.97449 Transcript_40356/m.97449 type:complete len:303 (-) Transcript_40356:195-1103(-)|eukprot:CAMPEP_0113630786 /NCGR_PEP_ID=MMETSP0017_2-20120614/15997_1 /TAXON_ID=2856 /ORGANISM="Cylindrotheca closterium" /LENGTH=302 /DNA_ID=CAMNT_0000541267 /DNA_START=213 /DNA_END=1121 /DNA_ORIENTATION=+ /assembly_acc=CAM_ASM_000147